MPKAHKRTHPAIKKALEVANVAPPKSSASPSPVLIWASGDGYTKAQSRELEATRHIMESGKAKLSARAMKGGHLTVWEFAGTTQETRRWLQSLRLPFRTI
jgi:hypothetical protein